MVKATEALRSGRATEVFARMVKVLGGPADFVEKAAHYLPKAPVVKEVRAPERGFVSGVATREIGLAVVALGGGRTRPQDPVDHAVGLTGLAPIGAAIEKGDPLAIVHARDDGAAEQAIETVLSSYKISASKPSSSKVILRRVAPA